MDTQIARGTFDVEMTPQDAPAAGGPQPGATPLGRLVLRKTFHGDMAGSGHGEMLTAVTPVEGSAAYVALERFSGTVHGRDGSFVLQHQGTMSAARGQQLTITVVPDSGSGALTGIEGRFVLTIAARVHHYALHYTLPG
jgi:Protein of unknown function (DUF3224)